MRTWIIVLIFLIVLIIVGSLLLFFLLFRSNGDNSNNGDATANDDDGGCSTECEDMELGELTTRSDYGCSFDLNVADGATGDGGEPACNKIYQYANNVYTKCAYNGVQYNFYFYQNILVLQINY